MCMYLCVWYAYHLHLSVFKFLLPVLDTCKQLYPHPYPLSFHTYMYYSPFHCFIHLVLILLFLHIFFSFFHILSLCLCFSSHFMYFWGLFVDLLHTPSSHPGAHISLSTISMSIQPFVFPLIYIFFEFLLFFPSFLSNYKLQQMMPRPSLESFKWRRSIDASPISLIMIHKKSL